LPFDVRNLVISFINRGYSVIDVWQADGSVFSMSYNPGVSGLVAFELTSVPETSTWMMMLLGFGGVAAARGEMSRRAAARRYEISESVAIKWLGRVERDGSREPVGHGGHRASKLAPHRDFLEAARAEKSDITLQALCDRLSAERGVKADTSMMSRFFRRIGVTLKKRPLSHASRIART
jgi:transposase